MKTLLAVVLMVTSVWSGTAARADTPQMAAPTGQFGAPIAADAKVVALTDAVAAYAADTGEQVIRGRVGQVCQKKGCWMTLSDGDVMARVMTDHKFALPKNLSGVVVVIGKLQAMDLDEKEVAHMAKDSGKAVGDIAAREYRIAARGVSKR